MSPKFRGKKPIDYLYERLHLLYPKRWEAQFDSKEHLEAWKECWGEELDERNVTFDEVKRGLARCIELYDWPPSFPEFLKACRPALDYEAAFHEAVEQMQRRREGKDRWSNPAIFWAAAKLGGDIMGALYVNVKSRWKAALDEAIHNVATGIAPREVPTRKAALPPPPSSKNMSPVALAELEKMKAIMNTKPKWKRELEERTGRQVSKGDSGSLKPVSEYLGNDHEERKAVNE